MNILHTSDWHLGRSLYGRKRYEEWTALLDFLAGLIEQHAIDLLLVCGDIFDTTLPGNRAQELYYRFLRRVAGSGCRHVVIIAGNHDSPSLLDAPRDLLEVLGVRVCGAAATDPADQVLVLHDASGQAEAIVCAVPYLRDRDVRQSDAGETPEEKDRRQLAGLRAYYAAAAAAAEQIRQGRDIPLLALGHLFAAGGRTIEGDGVRELSVGMLGQVGLDVFADVFDYVALGHLHQAQIVDAAGRVRYSGSPIPMGFGEAGHVKHVVLLRSSGRHLAAEAIPMPCFQELLSLSGDLDELLAAIHEQASQHSRAWLEIVYTGAALVSDLKDQIEAAAADSELEIRRIVNRPVIDGIMARMDEREVLADLDVAVVFERCLDAAAIAPDERPDLRDAYRTLVQALMEADVHAE
jgi:exonuclease SbcD